MPVRLQIRRGTASQWTAANPVLAAGEIAAELDTGKYKIGNGSTAWNSLAYSSGAVGPQGPQGTAGFTILNGSGAPGAGTGVNGDFFIDTTNKAIYGPKAAGSWGSATSLLPSLGSTAAADLGTAAAGTSLNAARADHVHSSTIVNPTFTGVAQFPDGSASAPSITNTGDTNTGLFHPAEDTVGISTGGVERMRVTSTGLVGIGTTAPNQQLTIARDTGVGQRLQTSASNAFILLDRSGSTIASPTIVASGEILGSIAARGYDGSAFRTAAQILFGVDGTPGASDMPGNIQFQTVPDGSITATERMRIDGNGLITGTGTSLGAWTAYTPTLGGTGWAIGNGTASGRYVQVGKTVVFQAQITFGSTSTFGAGQLTVSLPLTAASTQLQHSVSTQYRDSSAAALFVGDATIGANATTVSMRALSTASGQTVSATSTAPFTWDVSDEVRVTCTYQIA